MFDWQNLLVLGGVTAVVAGPMRRSLAIAAVLLFTMSFPPFSWPVWSFCLTPLAWIWRDRAVQLSRIRLALEAVLIGFAMGWVSTGFVGAGIPAWGWLIHAAACLLFSLQVVAAAVAIRMMRDQPVLVAAGVAALAATAGELLEAGCGVTWSVTNLALTVGATPVAQWSRWITPFGVSGVLYLVNFLLIPEGPVPFVRTWSGHAVLLAATTWRPESAQTVSCAWRWSGPATGVTIFAAAWCGGGLVAANVAVEALPFSVLLVQPHLIPSADEPYRPWLTLDQMTRDALSTDDAAVDLLVWPETCLSESWCDEPRSDTENVNLRLTLHDYARMLTPIYATNSLVGTVVAEVGTIKRYGLDVAQVRRYNCGCLVSTQGDIARHEKRELVPMKEGLPRHLDFDWLRDHVLPMLQFNPSLTYGRDYRPLSFRDRQGIRRTIAVSVCYESLLPWLPQYGDAKEVEAIIHLVYDGHSVGHPGVMQRLIRACQTRAIETRKWNLVCSTWSGSAIIDPSGRIVSQLSAVTGVLRNDVVNGRGIRSW